ncbi:MAG: hypothetical protein ACK4NW_02325 [Roseinatronobacter sp.]
MSAPDTNTTKQAKRHKPSLTGIALAVIAGGLLLVWMLGRVFIAGEETDGQAAPTQIEEQVPPQVDGTSGLPADGTTTEIGTDAPPSVIEEEPAPAE